MPARIAFYPFRYVKELEKKWNKNEKGNIYRTFTTFTLTFFFFPGKISPKKRINKYNLQNEEILKCLHRLKWGKKKKKSPDSYILVFSLCLHVCRILTKYLYPKFSL